MAKAGKPNHGAGIPQKHLHSRISYLYQAAVYLTAAETQRERERALPSPTSKTPANLPTTSLAFPPARLHGQQPATEPTGNAPPSPHTAHSSSPPASPHPLQPNTDAIVLLTSMRAVSHKSQIRLSRSIKRSVCRRCDALLSMHGTAQIENASRGGRKPWADVLVVKCGRCGGRKRYPVGEMRREEGRRGKGEGEMS